MTDETAPIDADDRLLTAATRWLRAILVPEEQDRLEPDPPPPVANQRGRRDRQDRRSAGIAPARRGRDTEGIRRTRRELDEVISGAPESRLLRFCDTFELTDFERDILILLFLQGTNLGIADMCAARSESDGGWPTFALSLRLATDDDWDARRASGEGDSARMAAEPDWRALSPEGPLRQWRMLEISQPGGKPLISSPLRLDERIVNHLKGIDYVDDRVAGICRRVTRASGLVSTSQHDLLLAATDRIRGLAESNGRVAAQLLGGHPSTTALFSAQLAARLGCELYRTSMEEISRAQSSSDFVRLWNREHRLQRVALDIDATDAATDQLGAMRRFLDSLSGTILVEVAEPIPGLEQTVLLDVARPTPAELRELWEMLLEGDADGWADRLAGQFGVDLDDVLDAVGHSGDDPDGQALWSQLRSRGRTRLEGLARRVVPAARLADVQLPDDARRMLGQIADHARNRTTVYDEYGFRSRLASGLGTTALFEGESGTGKTMAAEALANELQLDLYRIDLANVVSKYIGETEKNLRRVFDAAEEGSAVLLFDEADAIFGKRSEVQDSHDRYANIEVSYLLQRMEAYAGIAILTTNMKSALDQAFLRRLRFVITFPFPTTDERRLIWQAIFPGVRPKGLRGVEVLDLAELARPSLTGGQIRNIAVNAAFLAAAADGIVTMEHLRASARDELRKNGRPFVASDFAGWHNADRLAPTLVGGSR